MIFCSDETCNTRNSPKCTFAASLNIPTESATSFPGSFLYFENQYPGCGWSRVYACQLKPHRGWVLNLILSTSSREVNVGLLYGQYFEKGASYLSEILLGPLLRLYLNFYEYEMLIETKLCSYFTAFLNNGQQPASD